MVDGHHIQSLALLRRVILLRRRAFRPPQILEIKILDSPPDRISPWSPPPLLQSTPQIQQQISHPEHGHRTPTRAILSALRNMARLPHRPSRLTDRPRAPLPRTLYTRHDLPSRPSPRSGLPRRPRLKPQILPQRRPQRPQLLRRGPPIPRHAPRRPLLLYRVLLPSLRLDNRHLVLHPLATNSNDRLLRRLRQSSQSRAILGLPFHNPGTQVRPRVDIQRLQRRNSHLAKHGYLNPIPWL